MPRASGCCRFASRLLEDCLLPAASLIPLWLQPAFEGAVYVLTAAPLGLGALLATCLLIGRVGAALAPERILLFVAAATAARWVPGSVNPTLFVPGMLMLMGLLLACNFTMKTRMAGNAVVVIGGLAVGLSGGMQLASWQEIIGADCAYVLVLLAASLLFSKLPHVARLAPGAVVARRMAGAWIAATGSLMVALWLRGPGT